MKRSVFFHARVLAAVSTLLVGSAVWAGSQNYAYIKTCSFNSNQLGAVTIRLFKDSTVPTNLLADRAIVITSGSNSSPVVIDDLNVLEKFDAVLGARVLKATASYVTTQTRWVTVYENPNQSSWGRIKVGYVLEPKNGKRAEVLGEEVVDTDGCAASAF